METLASPVPVMPSYLDELAAVLASSPYSPSTTQVDTAYTLLSAIAEVEAWLHGRTPHRTVISDPIWALTECVSDRWIPPIGRDCTFNLVGRCGDAPAEPIEKLERRHSGWLLVGGTGHKYQLEHCRS
jgi:hypothetical protein